MSSDDTSCVVVTSPETIPEGDSFAGATLSYGGTATLPCSAQVTASNSSFGSDVVPVTVDQVADIGTTSLTSGASFDDVGSSLQTSGFVSLSTGAHGGVTIQIESSNPNVLRLSRDAVTPGLPVIEVPFVDGDTSEPYFVQGVRGAIGTATVVASSAEFTAGTLAIDVVEPILGISQLALATNTLANDDPFWVNTYIRNSAGNLQQNQAVSAEGPLPVTFSSSDTGVGVFTTLTQTSTSPVTINIPVNGYNTPTSVAQGGVAFDPVGGGTSTVTHPRLVLRRSIRA